MLKALTKDLFHGSAEYDETIDMMRSANKVKPTPILTKPPPYVGKPFVRVDPPPGAGRRRLLR